MGMTFLTFVPVIGCMAAALVAGCAAQSAQQPGRDEQQDFTDEFSKAKLRKNGRHLFCDQKAYTNCFKITRAQCLAELRVPAEKCYTSATEKFRYVGTEQQVKELYGAFGSCVVLRHVAIHADDRDGEALSKCLDAMQMDDDQLGKSMLR